MEKARLQFLGDKKRWFDVGRIIRERGESHPDGALGFIEDILKTGEAPKLNINDKIEIDKAVRRLQYKLKESSQKYSELLDSYDKLDELYNAALGFDNIIQPSNIKVKRTNEKSWAVPFIIWSDWHVGELINPEVVDGMNEYNPEIARSRAEMLFINTAKMIEKEMQSSHIQDIIIYLGGDFINGWIHEESRENNSMTPSEEVEFAGELLATGIQYILDRFDGVNLTLITNVGNHGRYTGKLRFENEYHTSFETLLYSNLIATFKDRVQFKIGKGTLTYLDVNNFTCRFYHGHQVRYRGGVGGLTIPLNKKQARWDQTRKAHFNFMGHYHTLSMPNSRTLLNGSLVGYNGLAQFAGFPFERPGQGFLLLHEKYDWTAFHRILADV